MPRSEREFAPVESFSASRSRLSEKSWALPDSEVLEGSNCVGSSRLQQIALATTPGALFGEGELRAQKYRRNRQAIADFIGYSQGVALNRAFAKSAIRMSEDQ
jgi:hypothetical protein